MGNCECGRLKGNPCGPLRPNTINVTMPADGRFRAGALEKIAPVFSGIAEEAEFERLGSMPSDPDSSIEWNLFTAAGSPGEQGKMALMYAYAFEDWSH